MPYYDSVKGIAVYKDDACTGCDLIHACNVISNLGMNQNDSDYHEVHIVQVGKADNRPQYIECQSYRPFIAPKDRPDRDPEFGKRLSQQEVDLIANPKRPYPEKF